MPPNPFSRVRRILRSDTTPPMNYIINIDNTSECLKKMQTFEEATYIPWSWLPLSTYFGQRRVGSLTGNMWVIDTVDHMHRELAVLTSNASIPIYDGYTNLTTGDIHVSFVQSFVPQAIDPIVFDIPKSCL
jgi:hypothetical protein